MKILCLLQNSWGNRKEILGCISFIPNPKNHSARVIRNLVGNNYFEFSNTTVKSSLRANQVLPPDLDHLKKVIEYSEQFDLILICGKQAKEAILKCNFKLNVPYLFIPHPASRNFSKNKRNNIKLKIRRYE